MNRAINVRRGLTAATAYTVSVMAVLFALGLGERAFAQWVTNGNNINNTNSGNVGIGTASPEQSLHVNGTEVFSTGTQSGFKFRDRAGGGTDNWVWYSTSNVARLHRQGIGDFLGVTTAGNVGIGTVSPTYKLHIIGSGASSGDGVLVTDSNTMTTVLDIQNTSAGAKKWRLQSVGSAVTGRVGNFEFVEIASDLKALVIQPGGNVGIGISSPTEKLHVAGHGKVTGNLTVDGNIAAKYQDVAEWVPSTQKLSAGTVVVLDTERTNQVVASSSPYDTGVAGVVSAQPGLILGEAGEDRVMVATTGRVKVKVDATRVPVKIGDLLVTGETPGVAMRSEAVSLGGVKFHRPGTIIGKALEPLEKGVGEILVLLSLQ